MKLGTVLRAVSLSLFGVAAVGLVWRTVALIPLLMDPAHRLGALVVLVSMWALAGTMGMFVFMFWWLERH
jgi:hypothetical protein